MTERMMQTRELYIDTVFMHDDNEKSIKRKLILEYSDSFPDTLYLKLISSDPSVDGCLNGFSMAQVEKLRKFLTQVHNLMKGATDGEEDKDSS
tara:strand:- start:244 stop:522 length:279 start_codon:yes stop_codon:yes gene_type:complete